MKRNPLCLDYMGERTRTGHEKRQLMTYTEREKRHAD